MKAPGLRTRIVLACLVVGLTGIALHLYWSLGELRPRYFEAMEESLADTAEILAPLAVGAPQDGRPDATLLAAAWERARNRRLDALIHDKLKTRVDLGAYCVDHRGTVLWHSDSPTAVGSDFSQWNDVVLGLRGEYGARATPLPDDGPMDAVLHVTAPVTENDQIVGLVTVFKAPSSIAPLERSAVEHTLVGAGIVTLLILLLGLVLGLWISEPLAKLTAHIRRLRSGQREATPTFSGEVGELASALSELRDELEGRRYAEHYVQGLTHELKSPLAAVAAHAELLEDESDPQARSRFLQRIATESERMRALIDRMLDLAALERREVLRKQQTVTVRSLLDSSQVHDATGHLDTLITGDGLLLQQALNNLIDNARSVSQAVEVHVERQSDRVHIRITDHGPGLPDYALDRLGERFFRAPIDGRLRGHGLGLAFVREVTRLHGGSWSLRNRMDGIGAEAILELPAATSDTQEPQKAAH